jgi:hypothetical protein
MIELKPSKFVVRQRVTRIIPTAEAKINTTNKGHHVVHNDQLLVMSPEELVLPELVGTTLDADILVQV